MLLFGKRADWVHVDGSWGVRKAWCFSAWTGTHMRLLSEVTHLLGRQRRTRLDCRLTLIPRVRFCRVPPQQERPSTVLKMVWTLRLSPAEGTKGSQGKRDGMGQCTLRITQVPWWTGHRGSRASGHVWSRTQAQGRSPRPTSPAVSGACKTPHLSQGKPGAPTNARSLPNTILHRHEDRGFDCFFRSAAVPC